MSGALAFDEASHTYRADGVVVPSVTQIIAPMYDFKGIPEDVLIAKRDLGRAVHTACEYDDEDDLDDSTIDASMAPYIAAYRAFKRDVKPVVVMNERKLYSRKYRYAGTIDRRFIIDGQPWTVDLKTTATMSPAVGLQLAAYDRLAQEEIGEKSRMGALQLKPDGKYKLHPFTKTGDFAVFLSLLNVHNWKAQNGYEN